MSTFKVQPVYAEFLMNCLDVAFSPASPLEIEEVLKLVSWRFKGGRLGDYAMKYDSPCSDSRWPNGWSYDIAREWGKGDEARALYDLILIRRSERVPSPGSMRPWIAGYAVARIVAARVAEYNGTDPIVYTGLNAVYCVLRDLLNPTSSVPPVKSLNRMFEYLKETVFASAAASNMDVPNMAVLIDALVTAMRASEFPRIEAALRQFIELMRKTKSSTARLTSGRLSMLCWEDLDEREDDVELVMSRIVSTLGPMRVYPLQNMMVVSSPYKCYVLSASDVIRVHQFLMGTSSAMMATMAQGCFEPGATRRKLSALAWTFSEQIRDILRWGANSVVGEEVLVCKVLKKGFAAHLCELAGPLAEKDVQALWNDVSSYDAISIQEIKKHFQRLHEWPAETAFNLGKLYKLCPAIDACPGFALMERHRMVANSNSMDPEMEEPFRIMLTKEMLRAWIRTPTAVIHLREGKKPPSWWGALKKKRWDEVPSAELDEYIEWEGAGVMVRRSEMNPAVWKDSGLGWDSYELACDPKKNKMHGNMLLRMVFDPMCPMPGIEYRDHLHDHKADIKPENYKDPPRTIFSGNCRDRLVQSSMEASVDSVAHYHPSFMIGADSVQRETRVRRLLLKPKSALLRAFYYSFDISGWSPNMAGKPQRISHEFWGKLFDSDVFRRAHEINEGARVYVNKHGYRGYFINPSSNFEGYNGKEMTCILITLLCLAVREWRTVIVARGLVSAAEAERYEAVLQAYIDDGMSRLDLPVDGGELLFEIFQGVVVRVFASCGYTVEVAKCYPSDRFWIFLNEIYIGGRHIAHGTRAAATICSESVEMHTTLVERTAKVSSGCRGAVVAGLDPAPAQVLQSFHVWRHLEEWFPRIGAQEAAIWTYMPRAWGGLGMPTMLQLGTSGGGAAFAEGWHTMQMWARINPTVKRVYLSCAKEALVERTSTSIMASPLGGRLENGVMTDSRIPGFIRDALRSLKSSGSLSPLATEFLGFSDHDNLKKYADKLIPVGERTVMQKQVIDDLVAAHPHAIFSAFCRRLDKSSTLMSLLTPKTLRMIARSNQKDASKSIEALRMRLMS